MYKKKKSLSYAFRARGGGVEVAIFSKKSLWAFPAGTTGQILHCDALDLIRKLLGGNLRRVLSAVCMMHNKSCVHCIITIVYNA